MGFENSSTCEILECLFQTYFVFCHSRKWRVRVRFIVGEKKHNHPGGNQNGPECIILFGMIHLLVYFLHSWLD